MEWRGISLNKTVEKLKENSNYEKEVLTEDKFFCNNNDYNPTKLPKQKMFSFMILKPNQLKRTVIVSHIQFVIFLFKKCSYLWLTEI